MGTNYYLHTDTCPHCKRSEHRIHIGKSSAGWPFLFRGYRKWPPDGVPAPITTAEQWWDFLADAVSHAGRIVDEYGHEHSYMDLKDRVLGKQDDMRGPLASNYVHGEHVSEWTDPKGFRFCDSEFS